jgi:SAM-dependent methyltransferase
MAGDFLDGRQYDLCGPMPAEELHEYSFAELNRDSGPLWETFSPIDDMGPHGTLADIYSRKGYATILDAGCGTGNQLRSLVDQAAARFNLDSSKIFADGVSDFDFSQLAPEDTAKAIQTGKINYQQLDLSTQPLPSATYDLVYAYEVLVHNTEPAAIVDNMWQALRPGGVAYFNLEGTQTAKLSFLLSEIAEHDGDVQWVKSEPSKFTRLRFERSNDITPPPTRYAFKLTKAQ